MVQCVLGGTSEETEPYSLSHPLVTLRGLRAIAAIPGLRGIKEYYGLGPDRDDPNLRMTGLFFRNPAIGEEEALKELAKPYGKAVGEMIGFWRPRCVRWTSRRRRGTLRGTQRSCGSSRPIRRIRGCWKTSNFAVRRRRVAWLKALRAGVSLQEDLPQEVSESFAQNLFDLGRFHRRALAYAYHLRETNIATCLRAAIKDGRHATLQHLVKESVGVMKDDLNNVCRDKLAKVGDPHPAAAWAAGPWPEMEAALDLAQKDLPTFLETYFGDAPDKASRGIFSATSC